MISPDNAIEIVRLSGLLATARVRRYAVLVTTCDNGETAENTTARVIKARGALTDYLDSLTEKA